MDKATLKAYAKINLGLDITGRRDDGYHLLKTVMQTVDIYDNITVSRALEDQEEEIKVTSDNASLPAGRSNIAYRAAELVKEKYSLPGRISIHIEKNIPMAAGLAGGSTDAAAVIKAVYMLFGLDWNQAAADSVALKLGADVPFCLRRGAWLCEGIGEILTDLGTLPGLCALIVKPAFEVSTRWCYGEFDRLENVPHPDMDKITAAVRAKDAQTVCENLGNVLEYAACPAHPEIAEIKKNLLACGAKAACMSGSGGTAFGLFTDKEKAREAAASFKKFTYVENCFAAGFIY